MPTRTRKPGPPRTPRNSDGGIWRMTWKPTPAGFEGWVVGHPSVRAQAPTFAAMSELLIDRINNDLQAGEWTADWSPPAPAAPTSRGQVLDSHITLSWEGRFLTFGDPREFFESWCERCAKPTGPRTRAPLRVAIEDPANLCADFDTAPGKLTIFSEKLAAAIKPLAGDQLTFRPVEMVGRSRTKYLEPIAAQPATLPRPVAMQADRELGWECPDCGFRYLYHDWQSFAATTFYRRTDLPHHRDCFILTSSFGSIDICTTAEWWKLNRRKPFARGVVGREIGVLEESQIDPSPRRRPHDRSPREHKPWRELWHIKQTNFVRYAPKYPGWTL